MSEKKLLIILLSLTMFVACIYWGTEFLISGLSGTRGEALSDSERKMVRRLEKSYNCKVKISHHSKAIYQDTEDSSINVSFLWKIKEGKPVDTVYNIAAKNDSIIIRFSDKVAQELIDIVADKVYYKYVEVSLNDRYFYKGLNWQPKNEIWLKYSILFDSSIQLIDFRRSYEGETRL